MDDDASAGNVNQYARGDHRHPTDITRASAADLILANNKINDLDEALDEFVATNQMELNAMQDAINAQGDLISKNNSEIAINSSDIESIFEKLTHTEHFRGYYATTNEITSISNPSAGDFAYNAQTGTKWAYNGTTWADTEDIIPDQTVAAYDGLPLVDSEASAGSISQYARGDHRHPTDTTRASVAQLGQAMDRIDNLDEAFEEFVIANQQEQQYINAAIDGNANNIASMMPRLSNIESEVDDLQAQADETETAVNRLATDLVELDERVTVNESDIASLYHKFLENENFKGYYLTTIEVTQIHATSGDFAWNAETGTVWVYDGNVLSWTDSLGAIPSDAVPASDLLPLVDGEASAGESTTYARGDHRHPTDETRAALSDIPTAVSQLANDSGFITSAALDGYITDSSLATTLNDYAKADAFHELEGRVKGVENSLETKAEISDIPTAVSQLTNDSGFITPADLTEYITDADLSDYARVETVSALDSRMEEVESNLENKAEISDIPTVVSQLTNDSGFITSVDLDEYVTDSSLTTILNDYAKTDTVAELSSSVEEMAASLESKAERSDIPTAVSQLANDSEFITSTDLDNYAKTEIVEELDSRVEGVENSLTSKANTSDIPTAVSQLTNDSGFIT
ncbi:MAG: hypothetical protein LUF85_08540, partial [Bacteroides sp.]|nr:hypothetical protein [Bacteroides sp.]